MTPREIPGRLRRISPDWSVILRLARRNPLYLLSMGFIGAYVIFSIAVELYPPITGYNPFQINLENAFQPPSLANPFGTDNLGRNIFAKVLAGAPIDLGVSILIVAVSMVVGVLLGGIAGYYGGLVEEVIMRATDIFLAFPGLILALAIASALGPGTANAVIALLVVWWPVYVRLARGETLTILSQQYIAAARATGLRRIKIVFSHVVPNIVPPVIAYATADLGSVIITFSVLGFLGLGAQPPLVDLGRVVFDGAIFIQRAPWYSILPGMVIFVIVVSYALIGDMIRDYLDPKSKA